MDFTLILLALLLILAFSEPVSSSTQCLKNISDCYLDTIEGVFRHEHCCPALLNMPDPDCVTQYGQISMECDLGPGTPFSSGVMSFEACFPDLSVCSGSVATRSSACCDAMQLMTDPVCMIPVDYAVFRCLEQGPDAVAPASGEGGSAEGHHASSPSPSPSSQNSSSSNQTAAEGQHASSPSSSSSQNSGSSNQTSPKNRGSNSNSNLPPSGNQSSSQSNKSP